MMLKSWLQRASEWLGAQASTQDKNIPQSGHQPVLHVHCDTRSHQGGRKNNEDAANAWLPEPETALCVLADGLGGYAGGELASDKVVTSLIHLFQTQPALSAPVEWLKTGFERANQDLLAAQAADENHERMRTTLVALLIHRGQAWWGHVGDSRLYHIRRGEIIAQTQDHSVVQMLLTTGEITADQVRGHPDRNRLLKVMGSDEELSGTFLEEGTLLENEDFLVLCSDGFWELMQESELLKHLDKGWYLSLADELLAAAIQQGQGNFDNLSFQLVHISAQTPTDEVTQ